MRVVFSRTSGGEISGSPDELLELARLLNTAHAEITAVEADPSPYEISLRALEIARVPGAARVRFVVSGRELFIYGSQVTLRTHAHNVLYIAARPGEHLHIEAIATPEFYIASDSEPMVVTCTVAA